MHSHLYIWWKIYCYNTCQSQVGKRNKKILAKVEHFWFRDRARTNNGSGAVTPKVEKFFALGSHTTMFQAEALANLECASKNFRRMYKRKCIYSHVTLKALNNSKKTSRLVIKCWKRELAQDNSVVLC